MKLRVKKMKMISIGLLMAGTCIAFAAPADSSKAAVLETVGEWKIYKSDETNYNSCMAKHTAHTGITLSEQKLVLSLKETKDLKSYQISVNDQNVVPSSRANLVDASCHCVRIRNISRLNVDDAVIRIQGEDNKDKAVDASVTLKSIPAVLQAFKAPACAR